MILKATAPPRPCPSQMEAPIVTDREGLNIAHTPLVGVVAEVNPLFQYTLFNLAALIGKKV